MADNPKATALPFFPWMPKPLGVLILFLLFWPPVFSGGAWLSNTAEMAGSLAAWTEDIQLASFYTAVGSCIFPPMMVKYLQTHRTKQALLWGFSLLTVCNLMCCFSTWHPALLISCVVTGFLRVVVIINIVFATAPYLLGFNVMDMFTSTKPLTDEEQYLADHKRFILLPVLYIVILVISQVANYVVAWCAYEFESWQMAYLFVVLMCLAALLIILLTFDDEPEKPDFKIDWRLTFDMLHMLACLLLLDYILIYGKTLDWFSSPRIVLATGLLLVSSGAFLWRMQKSDYLPMQVFTFRNVTLSVLLFFLFMVANSASSFIQSFAKLSTPINNAQSAQLALWSIIGLLGGFALSLWLVVRRVHVRWIFSVGFLFMLAASAYMYFQYQTDGLYQNMYLPIILNFAGLVILYPLVAAFGMMRLPPRYLAAYVFIMIWMRNAIAPVAGASIYTNWMQERQQYYNTRLVQGVDQQDISWKMSTSAAASPQAQALAVPMLYASKSKQAALLAMRDISGASVWLILGMIGITLILPYRKGEKT